MDPWNYEQGFQDDGQGYLFSVNDTAEVAVDEGEDSGD